MNESGRGTEADLRRHMRKQANENPAFMREWAKHNRQWRSSRHEWKERRSRFESRRRRKELKKGEKNRKHLQENHEAIKNGKHFGWLRYFAYLYLNSPEEKPEWIPSSLIEQALLNCLPRIEPQLPSLKELARQHCASKGYHIVNIFAAASLSYYRKHGHLNGIGQRALAVLKANMDVHFFAVKDDEKEAFEREVNRLLFRTDGDLERFVRDYIEEQLKIDGCPHPNVNWLLYKKEFKPLQEKLPFAWLRKYPNVSLETVATLFDLSVPHAERAELQELIVQRCEELLQQVPEGEEEEKIEQARKFWFLRHFFFIEAIDERIWRWIASSPDNLLLFEGPLGRPPCDEYADWPRLSAEKIYRIMDAFIEKWPKVPLPSSWGTGSPKPERAYRLLTDIIWHIGKDEPERSLPVLERMLEDDRFWDFRDSLKHMRANALRWQALKDFTPPKPLEVVKALEQKAAATVEDLRALVIDELERLQKDIKGGEFNTVEKFHDGGTRVDEITATNRIAEHLKPYLEPLDITTIREPQMKDQKRCDITFSTMIGGSRKLLVMEVKGQWNPELFTAAEAQLHERYAIHPDAEDQGIYLVLWFGKEEKVAGRKNANIDTPEALRRKIVNELPDYLRGRIDVFVLDLSK